MTHTLHRQGPVETLEKDYCVLALVARQFDLANDERKASAVKRLQGICETMAKYGPANLGSLYVKNGTYSHDMSAEEIRAGLKPNGFVLCVYSDQNKFRDCLAELKEKDYGISITVSGLIGRVFGTCEEVGLMPHTISYSLGVWGKKSLLPKMELLEISSMCGHAMTSPNLVNNAIQDIKAGRTTAQAAAKAIARPCACGCFNTDRAADLLQKAASA
ncbi:MAG TPA: hypothetical protein VHS06_04570 [Chloroflexota bacterium]|nr:hypothetical protein [Chloroflexota bacterium]